MDELLGDDNQEIYFHEITITVNGQSFESLVASLDVNGLPENPQSDTTALKYIFGRPCPPDWFQFKDKFYHIYNLLKDLYNQNLLGDKPWELKMCHT